MTGVDHPHNADQLRRRREASWRLPPLPDGRRDPLDPVRLTRPVVWVTEDPARGRVLVTGTSRRTVWAAIRAAGLTAGAVWSDAGGGWVVPSEHAADLAWVLERAEVVVRSRKRPERKQATS